MTDHDILVFLLALASMLALARLFGELGRLAIGALVAQIEGQPARDLEVTTAPELVLRASTGAPPRTDREGR